MITRAFSRCQDLGCSRSDIYRYYTAMPRGVPHEQQVPFIRLERQDWTRWRMLNEALADGIPEPAL